MYSEKDLEEAILREMEPFLLELGAGFTFAARQKRMVVDGKDFYNETSGVYPTGKGTSFYIVQHYR